MMGKSRHSMKLPKRRQPVDEPQNAAKQFPNQRSRTRGDFDHVFKVAVEGSSNGVEQSLLLLKIYFSITHYLAF